MLGFPDLHFFGHVFVFFLCEYEVNMAVNAEKSERRELRRRWEAHEKVTAIDRWDRKDTDGYCQWCCTYKTVWQTRRVLSPLCLTSDPWYWSICGGLCGTAEFKSTRCSRTHIKSTFHNIFQTSFEFQISFASLCPSLFPLPGTLSFVFVVLFRCVFDDLSISSSRCQDKHWWSQSIGGVWNWKIGSLPAQSQPSHYLWWLLWWLWHCSLATLPWLSMFVAPSCWWFVCSPDVCWCLDTTQRISPQNFPSISCLLPRKAKQNQLKFKIVKHVRKQRFETCQEVSAVWLWSGGGHWSNCLRGA